MDESRAMRAASCILSGEWVALITGFDNDSVCHLLYVSSTCAGRHWHRSFMALHQCYQATGSRQGAKQTVWPLNTEGNNWVLNYYKWYQWHGSSQIPLFDTWMSLAQLLLPADLYHKDTYHMYQSLLFRYTNIAKLVVIPAETFGCHETGKFVMNFVHF